MDKWLYRISVALVVLGLLVSIYMTDFKVYKIEKMCIVSIVCNIVNASKYSEVYGIPVAVFGVLGYAAILATLFFENRNNFFKQNGTLMVFGMALTGFIFTAWLIYVEVAIIKALCPFCITSQVAMTIIFIIAVTRLIRQPQS